MSTGLGAEKKFIVIFLDTCVPHVHFASLSIYLSIYIYIYYKEQRQLKTFLTQIGPALSLTLDPPVICFWKWIGWKDYEVTKKSQFGEHFYQK
jgi:hypothetical protein